MTQQFIGKIKDSFLELSVAEKSSQLLVGVSGGADSMVLLHALHFLGFKAVVAHVNYQQRGIESYADEILVKDFCEQNKLPFYVKKWPFGKDVASFQEKAREFRYSFFQEVKQQVGCGLILTAHHRNDRIEGFLYNLARGTGLVGMDAIRKKDAIVFRPLLDISKSEIIEYASLNSVSYRDDESNFENKYRRNFIRLDVVPKVEEIHPKALDNVVNFLDRSQGAAAELNRLYSRLRSQCLKNAEHANEKVMEWDVEALVADLVDVKGFLYNTAISMGLKCHQNEIDLLAEHFGKTHDESKIVAIEDHCFEFFGRKLYSYPSTIFAPAVLTIKSLLELQNFCISGKKLKVLDGFPTQFEKGVLYLDAEKLLFPLKIRPPQQGDKMKPYGMNGKVKSVADLMTHEKYPAWKKKMTELCFDSENELAIFAWSRHSQNVVTDESTKKTIIIS